MSKTLNTSITISRPQNYNGDKYIEITLNDKVSGIQFASTKLSLEDFAEALTGLAYVECTTKVMGLEHVGKRKERESASIFMSNEEYEKVVEGLPFIRHKEALAAWLLANHSREGWHMNTYLGSQGSIQYVGGGKKLKLNIDYYRYV